VKPHRILAQLAEYRRVSGLTQHSVARRLHVGSSTVSWWETGRCIPPMERLDAYAALFGLRPDLIPLEVPIVATIRCQSCRNVYDPPGIDQRHLSFGARVAGWILWEGTTEGGSHVKRVYCPRCVGREVVDAGTGETPSWDAECQTCHATMSEEWREDVPLSEDDAKLWKDEHRCEPDVHISAPKHVVAA
jgi:transcriptional regulator with XRE-family HTH domain